MAPYAVAGRGRRRCLFLLPPILVRVRDAKVLAKDAARTGGTLEVAPVKIILPAARRALLVAAEEGRNMIAMAGVLNDGDAAERSELRFSRFRAAGRAGGGMGGLVLVEIVCCVKTLSRRL